jgi:hypothetical protein
VYFVERAYLSVDESRRWVRYERALLYVLVPAFALETYYLTSAFDLAPSSGAAVDGLVVYVP